MEMRGIEPRASRMQSERSTIWATSPFMTKQLKSSNSSKIKKLGLVRLRPNVMMPLHLAVESSRFSPTSAGESEGASETGYKRRSISPYIGMILQAVKGRWGVATSRNFYCERGARPNPSLLRQQGHPHHFTIWSRNFNWICLDFVFLLLLFVFFVVALLHFLIVYLVYLAKCFLLIAGFYLLCSS